jgi:hypothetical protein
VKTLTTQKERLQGDTDNGKSIKAVSEKTSESVIKGTIDDKVKKLKE